jgi:hypothetical protein
MISSRPRSHALPKVFRARNKTVITRKSIIASPRSLPTPIPTPEVQNASITMSLRILFPRTRPWTCRTCLQQSTVAAQQLLAKRATHVRTTQKYGYATGRNNPWIETTPKEAPKAPITQTSKKAVPKEAKQPVPPTSRILPPAAKSASNTARTVSETVKEAANGNAKSGSKPKPKRRRRLLIAGVSGSLIIAGAVAFNDEARHVAVAVQRTGRVIGTLIVCVNEYVFLLLDLQHDLLPVTCC